MGEREKAVAAADKLVNLRGRRGEPEDMNDLEGSLNLYEKAVGAYSQDIRDAWDRNIGILRDNLRAEETTPGPEEPTPEERMEAILALASAEPIPVDEAEELLFLEEYEEPLPEEEVPLDSVGMEEDEEPLGEDERLLVGQELYSDSPAGGGSSGTGGGEEQSGRDSGSRPGEPLEPSAPQGREFEPPYPQPPPYQPPLYPPQPYPPSSYPAFAPPPPQSAPFPPQASPAPQAPAPQPAPLPPQPAPLPPQPAPLPPQPAPLPPQPAPPPPRFEEPRPKPSPEPAGAAGTEESEPEFMEFDEDLGEEEPDVMLEEGAEPDLEPAERPALEPESEGEEQAEEGGEPAEGLAPEDARSAPVEGAGYESGESECPGEEIADLLSYLRDLTESLPEDKRRELEESGVTLKMDEIIQALGDGDLESKDETTRLAAEDKLGKAAAALESTMPGASSLLRDAQNRADRRAEDRRTGEDRRAAPTERRAWMDRRDGGDRRLDARRRQPDRRLDERAAVPVSGEPGSGAGVPEAEGSVVFDPQGRPTEVCGVPISSKLAKLFDIMRREKGHGRKQ